MEDCFECCTDVDPSEAIVSWRNSGNDALYLHRECVAAHCADLLAQVADSYDEEL